MIFPIIIVALLAIGFYIVTVYNGLQLLKTQIKASIQEIGNQLKRQISLIPNLETSVKSYLQHEKGIYEMITKARQSIEAASKSGAMDDIEKASTQLQSVIPQIKVMVESNPELKANETVQKFMDELTDTADKLMYSRRTLIDLTQAYNAKLVTFPSNLIANMFGFTAEKGLATPETGAHVEVSQEETKDVKVNLD
jgi:LemA protein